MYAYNPSGTWTAMHQMSLAGKRDGFTFDDFKSVAETASMKRGRTRRSLARSPQRSGGGGSSLNRRACYPTRSRRSATPIDSTLGYSESRGDWMAFELFVQGVEAWGDDVKRLVKAA